MAQQTNDKTADYEKPDIKKILIAVDKSGYKQKIIAYAIALAKSLGASVIAIHVLDKASFGMVGNMVSYYRGGKTEEYERVLTKQAEQFLNETRVFLEREGVSASIHVVVNKSSAAEGIIDYAKEAGADLIVIGTKGLTGVQRFLMGGVASSVIGHAHCPVLAVR